MSETQGRSWLYYLIPVFAVIGLGVWFWTQSDGTAAPSGAEAPAASVATGTDAEYQPIPVDFQGPIAMTVYRAPTCGCCGGWVEHVTEHGFEPESEMTQDMASVKEGFAVPMNLSSCHTAVVEGYLIEGHVPAEDIRRLLAERPDARGLAVPGMPVGSPGMEMGDQLDRYDVLLFDDQGSTEVWASYGDG